MKKSHFFDFFNLLILWSLKEVSASKISCNTFSWSILTKIKRMDQLPIFDQDRGLCTFEKSQFFDFFKLLVFYSLERYFFVLGYHETLYAVLFCLKQKKMEKLPIFYQNHGLIPLKKCYFFAFFNFCFYCLRRCFFFLEYHKTHISSLFRLK